MRNLKLNKDVIREYSWRVDQATHTTFWVLQATFM